MMTLIGTRDAVDAWLIQVTYLAPVKILAVPALLNLRIMKMKFIFISPASGFPGNKAHAATTD
jgi:hypothetical protein